MLVLRTIVGNAEGLVYPEPGEGKHLFLFTLSIDSSFVRMARRIVMLINDALLIVIATVVILSLAKGG
jgi:hypothetical protein